MQALELQGSPGTEWVYALAVKDSEPVSGLERELAALERHLHQGPVPCRRRGPRACGARAAVAEALEQAVQASGGSLAWIGRQFQHAPSGQ